MKLNNSQYDSIMRMYNAKQNKSRTLQTERYEEVCAKIPEYEALCQRSASLSADAARRAEFIRAV